MTTRYIVLGGGGHARVVLAAWKRSGGPLPDGVLDADPTRAGADVAGVPVIGNDATLDDLSPETVILINGIGAVGSATSRARAFEAASRRGFRFATVLDPSAVLSGDVELGAGAQVLAGAILQPNVRIGRDAIVNTRAAIDHDCQIGDHAHIAPGATLAGDVRIGPRAFVGAGATVIQGLVVGTDAVVGAGAVVVRDVPDGATVIGVPARIASGR